MRYILSIIFACFALSLVTGQDNFISLDEPFSNLKVTGNIHLELVASDTPQLIILSGGNPEELEIESGNKELLLKTKSELANSASIKLKLHYVHLSGLEITKGSRVQSGDTLFARVLQLDVLTGGKAELIIRADSISARVNQGADIILYGSTISQFINAYTWGNYLAYDLETTNSYVKAATGAQVKVNASGLLDAKVTSKAFVGFWGTPEVKNFKTSVGGEITQLTE